MADAFSVLKMTVIMMAFVAVLLGLSRTLMEPGGPRGEPGGVEREFADQLRGQ
jgi:hypothetical protein